ncbi:uncharacterized protein [Amphiura filiformis]|uniref:uncharacterized protein n=1 Tax=Amphiura filiformis TaxID=82378 RepID=UPI003B2191AD
MIETTGNEASASIQQLLAVIQEQKEDQGNQQLEAHQSDSQAPPGSLLEDDEDVPESLRRQYVCDKCGKVYRSRCGIKGHVKAVHEQTLHVCHICGATMKWEPSLQAHLRTVHKIGGPKRSLTINRKCQECGATFRNNGLFYDHLKKVHKVTKPIKCKVCNMTFRAGAPWYDHKKMHPEEYHCYTCDVCQSRFTTLGGFKRHQLQSGHGNNVNGQDGVTIEHGDVTSDVTTGENIKTNVKGHAADVDGRPGIDTEKTVASDSTKDHNAAVLIKQIQHYPVHTNVVANLDCM